MFIRMIKTYFPFAIILAIGLFHPVESWGKDISFTATVNRTSLTQSDYFTLTLEVKGSIGSLPTPEISALEDFYILSGPNESTNFQYINGRLSASKSITYALQPKRAGELIIPSAKVVHKRKTYTTDPITIEVTGGAVPPKSGRKSPSKPRAGKPSTTPRADRQSAPSELFLQAKVDKKSLVQNDIVVVIYNLYMLVNVSTYEISKLPNTVGFWTEEFKLPRQPVIREEIINGKRYQVATIKKMALFPTRPGKMTIDPLEIQCQVHERRKSRFHDPFDHFFDDPFFSRSMTVPRYVQSQPVTLNVKSFPEKDKPDDFNGAVGDFTLKASVDKDSVEVNQPLTLTVRISGRGNIKIVSLPKLDIPPDFEKYDPEVDIKTNKSSGVVRGSKEYKYLLVPRFPGRQSIPPISFSYYDPSIKLYKTLKTQPFDIEVAQGNQILLPGGIAVSPEQVRLYGQDIHFIKTATGFRPLGRKFYRGILYYLGFIVPFILLAGGSTIRAYYYRRNPQKIRARNAFRTAKRKLEQAGKMGGKAGDEEFLRILSDSLKGYIADKIGVSVAGMILEYMEENLAANGVSRDAYQSFLNVVNEVDMGRYSKASMGNLQRRELAARSTKQLEQMEKLWKN